MLKPADGMKKNIRGTPVNKSRWLIGAGAGVAFIGLAGFAPLQAQFVMESNGTRIELGGRLHLEAATSTCSDFTNDGDPASSCFRDVPMVDMFVRRARIRLDVDFNKWISARIQPDFALVDGVRLADAYGRLNLNPDAEHAHALITVGHFKRPFDGFTMISSTDFLTIERAVIVPGLLSPSFGALVLTSRLADRDVGAMIDGGTADDRLHYWVGFFNGNFSTSNRDSNSGKQIVGRAQLKLFEGPLPLTVAVAGTVADQPFDNTDGSLGGRSHGAFEVFSELGDYDGGVHVQAGVITGKNTLQNKIGERPDHVADDPLADMLLWQVIGGWKFDVRGNYFLEAIEPVLRITMTDPNGDIDDNTVWGFTPGVQLFFAARNKVEINWDLVSLPGGQRSESSFKIQYQFYY